MKMRMWVGPKLATVLVLVLPGCQTGESTSASVVAKGTSCEKAVSAPPKSYPVKQAPLAKLPAGRWAAEIVTNCGKVLVALDQRSAPRAVAAFVERARGGFYNGLTFHRVAPGFVVQGGDPLGDGTGGPGYQTVDLPAAGSSYGRGTVAMAKSPDQRPGTAGSQFFIVTAEDAGLPADYAIIGSVAGPMTAVDRISAAELDPSSLPAQGSPDGRPKEPIVIRSVNVLRDGRPYEP